MAITVRFDVDKLVADMAARGWQPVDLAAAADVAASTVGRFLSGEFQTLKTATKLAKALGYSVRRYVVSAKAVA